MIEEKDFVSLELAKLIKEKFGDEDIHSFAYYGEDNKLHIDETDGFFSRYAHVAEEEEEIIVAPSLSDMQNFLREKEKLYVYANPSCCNNDEGDGNYYWTYNILDLTDDDTISSSYIEFIDMARGEKEEEFNTYEEALSGGIKEAIEHYVDTIK